MIGGGHRVVAQAGNIQDAIVLVDGFFQRSDLGANLRIGALKHWRFKNRTGPKNHQLNFHRLGAFVHGGKNGTWNSALAAGCTNSHHNLAVVVPRPLTR